MSLSSHNIRIASIDFGVGNFAHFIQDCSVESLKQSQKDYNSLSKIQKKPVLSPQTETIIKNILMNGVPISYGVDEIVEKNKRKTFTCEIRRAVILFLESMFFLWSTCDIFVLEIQYAKRGAANFTAIKLAELVFGYFATKFPGKEIVFFPSRYKTQCFDSSKKTKPERKKFTIEFGKEICTWKNDTDLLEILKLSSSLKRKRNVKFDDYFGPFINSQEHTRRLAKRLIETKMRGEPIQKLDDVFDSMLQCEAYKFRVLVCNLKL